MRLGRHKADSVSAALSRYRLRDAPDISAGKGSPAFSKATQRGWGSWYRRGRRAVHVRLERLGRTCDDLYFHHNSRRSHRCHLAHTVDNRVTPHDSNASPTKEEVSSRPIPRRGPRCMGCNAIYRECSNGTSSNPTSKGDCSVALQNLTGKL